MVDFDLKILGNSSGEIQYQVQLSGDTISYAIEKDNQTIVDITRSLVEKLHLIPENMKVTYQKTKFANAE